jgi:hypothetical protein
MRLPWADILVSRRLAGIALRQVSPPLTTFSSCGDAARHRQAEIIRSLGAAAPGSLPAPGADAHLGTPTC